MAKRSIFFGVTVLAFPALLTEALRRMSRSGDGIACPTETTPEKGDRVVLFPLRDTRLGSSIMRGYMLAAAVDRQPGWWSRALPVQELKSHAGHVDVCVFPKALPTDDLISACKERGALVFYDILDNMEQIHALRQGKAGSGIDTYLTSSYNLANLLNTGREHPIASKLPHQHSNRGFTLHEPSLPYACQVSILTGSSLFAPDQAQQDILVERICSSAKVVSVAFIHQITSPSRRIDRGCPSATEEMNLACKSQPAAWAQRPAEEARCFEEQDRFNGDTALLGTDLALLWAAPDVDFQERPWTRMLFWMSHGVPACHFPMHAYSETAELGYSAPTGQSLLVQSEEDVAEVVGRLAGSLEDRHALRKKGLAIAAEWDTKGVGAKMAALLAQRLGA